MIYFFLIIIAIFVSYQKFGSYWERIMFDNLLFIESLLFITVEVIMCVCVCVCIYTSHTHNPRDSWQIFEVASFRQKEVEHLAQSICWRQDSNTVVWLQNSHLIFSGYCTTFRKKEKIISCNLPQGKLCLPFAVFFFFFFPSPRVFWFSFCFFKHSWDRTANMTLFSCCFSLSITILVSCVGGWPSQELPSCSEKVALVFWGLGETEGRCRPLPVGRGSFRKETELM